MKKSNVIEVLEYDTLAVNSEPGSIDQKSFDQLEQMILQMNAIAGDAAIDFLSLSAKRGVGKVIRARNYVGVLQLTSQQQLQILPKIHGVTKTESKTVLLKMLKTLGDFPSKTFNVANLSTENMPIFEVFITLYIREVQSVIRKGLQSSYYPVEDNLTVYKGKMNFSKQIRHNLTHKERFYVAYDEFGLNRAENRLLKTTLVYLNKQSISEANRKAIKQLLHHFDAVETSKSIEHDFSHVHSSRNMIHYESALKWAKVFLKSQSFTSFSGDTAMNSLLYPMERLFESYVGKSLKHLLHNSDWNISLQDRTYYLFEKKFALRPDIVIRHRDKNQTIVIDTKWKVLENKPNRNYGISQADMYQMYAYGKKYNATKIFVMYPMHDGFDQDQVIHFKSDDDVEVNILFVQCENVEISLTSFLNKHLF
ncbi:restriction endonuclease [Exiguobacterium sp. SH0S1]|uniref:McrC family protein n=1 Tax=Exiguobacterium sp. SH0S1 TaxID=2510949 RepID=UPI00103ACFC0|nr:McrC family protein [Exiguobacterium sp. SH0S1]TCI75710.1 restriction endonuclease [Exiguobacterium sp. SH0S1]